MHLKHPRFTCIDFGPFAKNKERIPKIKEPEDTKYIYRNELDKPCFQHDMAYEDFKDLARITFNIAKNPKFEENQEFLLLWLKNSLIKRSVELISLHLQKNLLLIMKLNKISNWLKNYTNLLSEI